MFLKEKIKNSQKNNKIILQITNTAKIQTWMT